MTDIKSMGLYRNVERIMTDLEAAGITSDQTLTVDDLTPYDQYHYEGTAAVDDAIGALRIGQNSHLLDVGSGLGGPARYIADRASIPVTALEIQADLHTTAKELTVRCELDNLVTHLNGDFLTDDVPSGAFTGLVSMLCFLHIADRAALFTACARSLTTDGIMFIDDYYLRGSLSGEEEAELNETVFCSYLPDLASYRNDVVSAGFELQSVIDKTTEWTTFVVDRLAAFRHARSDLTNRYGTETYDSLDHFYRTVADLFTGGGLGGVRLVARRL